MMRSRGPNPILEARTRLAAAFGAGGLILAGSVWWAWSFPRERRERLPVITERPAKTEDVTQAALDLQAFQARLWAPPPAPAPVPVVVAPPPPPPPMPPLRLQLVAIVQDAAIDPPRLSAALYDPDADRILMVQTGQQIGPRTISGIGTAFVELFDGSRVRRLELHPPGARP